MTHNNQDGLTIAIVVHNEEENILRTLNSIFPEESMPFKVEIIVVDNKSKDQTHSKINEWSSAHPLIPLQIIENSENNLGSARNLAIENAKYAIVGFLDGDCVSPKGWAQFFYTRIKAERELNPSLLGMGSGNIVPDSESLFYAALKAMLTSPLGSMNTVQARPLLNRKIVFHLPTCNVFYLKERALALGNFSPIFASVCEDLEFHHRARRSGAQLIYEPNWEVTHYHRKSFWEWLKKMFRYGYGQILVAENYPEHLLGTKFLPLLFALVGASMLLLIPELLIKFTAMYLALVIFYSAFLAWRSKNLMVIPSVFFLFVITHCFYSLGECWGIVMVAQKKYGKMK